MNLNLQNTQLTKISDIKVPDIFYRRMKTGIHQIDGLFDEGILPGSSYTLTAKAGCGKTTFMLQLLDGLSTNRYSIGYFSGEESIYQLAYTANRIGTTNVSVANVTDVDDIAASMQDLDFIVIDSFQALTTKSKMNSRALEKYAVQTLVQAAKKTECVVVFIMHLTKSGDLKGGTIVPHTVDANLKISIIPEAESDDARVVYFEKNRFGPLNELECTIGPKGYDFKSVVVREDAKGNATKAPSKSERKQADLDKILNHEGVLSLSTVSHLMDGNVQRAQNLLRELCITDRLIKWGKGQSARWSIVNQAEKVVND
jgi:predicted ATP-dependent serine protease